MDSAQEMRFLMESIEDSQMPVVLDDNRDPKLERIIERLKEYESMDDLPQEICDAVCKLRDAVSKYTGEEMIEEGTTEYSDTEKMAPSIDNTGRPHHNHSDGQSYSEQKGFFG